MDLRAQLVVRHAAALTRRIDYELLMMILRGQSPSKGWRLAVIETGEVGRFETRVVAPRDPPPFAKCTLLGCK
jgi:hypothetical protein